jgi:hypothetical protein
MNLINKTVKVTKLSDDVFNGNHPNNINEGYTKEGLIIFEPIIGYPLVLSKKVKLKGSFFNIPIFYTSNIKNIDYKKLIINTENSTYQIDIIDDEN